MKRLLVRNVQDERDIGRYSAHRAARDERGALLKGEVLPALTRASSKS